LRDSRFPNPAKPDIGSNDKNHEISATPVVIVPEFAIDALEKCERDGFRKILADAETIVLLVTCLPSRSLREGWSPVTSVTS